MIKARKNKGIYLFILSILVLNNSLSAYAKSLPNAKFFSYNDILYYTGDDEGCGSSSIENGGSSSIDSSAAGDTDWTKEGTEAYKNAKKVFEAWINAGVSGAAAAGVVGWVNSEGGFSMVGRAEGHFGSDLKTNSIAYGVEPVGQSYYTTAAGGGIYQFTPYTKYAPLGSPDWENPDKMTAAVIKFIAGGDWIPGPNDLTGGSHSFQQFAQETDPQQATLMWNSYERGNPAYIHTDQKKSDAQKAYDLFNGSKYKYDKDKFAKTFGSSSTESPDSSSSGDSDSISSDGCSSSGSNHGGSGTWAKDGEGEFPIATSYFVSKMEEMPDNIKKYALDPRSVGMQWRSSQGWQVGILYDGGQCTELTANLGYAIWEKDGQHPTMKSGDGKDVARNWASTFGGSVTTKPSAGAIFSQTPESAGNAAQGNYGHTGIVSHVFSDGGILVVEQNYSTLSGTFGGFGPWTWSYRYVPAAQYATGWTFYSPADVGYKLVDSAKAME